MKRRSGIKEALSKKVHPIILFLVFLLIILTTAVGMRTYESNITSLYDNINQTTGAPSPQSKSEDATASINTGTKEDNQNDDQPPEVASGRYGNTQTSTQSSMQPATPPQQPATSQSKPPPEQPTSEPPAEPFICILGLCL